jgi:hypothetical protein
MFVEICGKCVLVMKSLEYSMVAKAFFLNQEKFVSFLPKILSKLSLSQNETAFSVEA